MISRPPPASWTQKEEVIVKPYKNMSGVAAVPPVKNDSLMIETVKSKP